MIVDGDMPGAIQGFLRRYRAWLVIEGVLGLLLCGTLACCLEGDLVFVLSAVWVSAGLAGLFVVGRGLRTTADAVTLFRAGLVLAGPLALIWHGGLSWAIVLLFGVAASLDLTDGWLARRHGGTEQGAVYDMETDQMLVFAASVAGVHAAGIGAWLLLAPALKYLYILFSEACGIATTDPKPQTGDNRRARVVCAMLVVILVGNLAPGIPGLVRSLASGIGLVLLVLSFADDFVYLLRHRRGWGSG